MSGAFGYEWGTLATGGFFLLLGAINLVPRRYEPAPEPGWLVEARERYGRGTEATPSAPSPLWDIVPGVGFVFLGVLQFVSRHPFPLGSIFMMMMGGLFLVFGLSMLVARLRPERARGSGGDSWSERRLRRKLERRIARGTDAYHEELRTLLVPAPPRRVLAPGWQLVSSILFTLSGAGLFAAGLATPR